MQVNKINNTNFQGKIITNRKLTTSKEQYFIRKILTNNIDNKKIKDLIKLKPFDLEFYSVKKPKQVGLKSTINLNDERFESQTFFTRLDSSDVIEKNLRRIKNIINKAMNAYIEDSKNTIKKVC